MKFITKSIIYITLLFLFVHPLFYSINCPNITKLVIITCIFASIHMFSIKLIQFLDWNFDVLKEEGDRITFINKINSIPYITTGIITFVHKKTNSYNIKLDNSMSIDGYEYSHIRINEKDIL